MSNGGSGRSRYRAPVDIGIQNREEIHGVLNKKIRCEHKEFFEEPAMTEEETVRAMAVGMELVRTLKGEGIPDTGNRRDGDWQYNDQQCYGSGTF